MEIPIAKKQPTSQNPTKKHSLVTSQRHLSSVKKIQNRDINVLLSEKVFEPISQKQSPEITASEWGNVTPKIFESKLTETKVSQLGKKNTDRPVLLRAETSEGTNKEGSGRKQVN